MPASVLLIAEPVALELRWANGRNNGSNFTGDFSGREQEANLFEIFFWFHGWRGPVSLVIV